MTANPKASVHSRQVGKFIKLKGTKPSLHNAQLLVSTGVPSLDHLVGGGIPVGSIFLIEEDSCGKYSKLLLKYFLAEGIVCENDLFIASSDNSPSQLVKELPNLIQTSNSSRNVTSNKEATEKMKIAWRYQNRDAVKTSMENSTFGHYYDLSQNLDQQLIHKIDIVKFDGIDDFEDQKSKNSESIFDVLYNKIKNRIEHGNFNLDMKNINLDEEKTILRIGINSLGSSLWSYKNTKDIYQSVPLFLLRLKALLRASLAVSVVTVPTQLLRGFEAHGCLHRLERIADNVLHLESFLGSDKEKNPLYKDFHGLLYVKKFARINSLTCHVPSTFDLAFKLKTKSFVIETLHLPPDLSETVSRSQQNIPTSGSSCSSTVNQGLDF
ncbi:Elongator complex protein 4 [Nymphon striatum]|nr:Elongator complex protein 4 [Nymphon striatum]